MPPRADELSLADFFISDSDSVLEPPSGWDEWRRATRWATSLYENELQQAPTPRTTIRYEGGSRRVINLTSYNYLGLGTRTEVVGAARRALEEWGTGACGSPLLAGSTELHRRLERQMVEFLGREACLLFSSGFAGALGSLSGLLRRGDVAVMDSDAHISLLDGAKLARAKVRVFDHNDPESLDRALRESVGRRRLIVLEGIYSMGGDMADLPALLPVAEAHEADVIIDEAHSILTCGEQGRGVAEAMGVEDRINLVYGTFSKAFAGMGGMIAGGRRALDYLRWYADSLGFSCALAPPVVAGLSAALDVARREPELRWHLRESADYFRRELQGLGLDTGASTSHVIPIFVGSDRALLYELGRELRQRGLLLAPVDYPSVPQDRARFRAVVTAAHSREDLDESLQILADTLVGRVPSPG